MTFGIIEIASHQYLVKPGEIFTVSGLAGSPKSLNSPLLLLFQENKLKLGQPYLDLTAKITVVKQAKGPKTSIQTYKAKSRYRKHRGYRDTLSTLQVDSLGDPTPTPKRAVKTKKPAA